MWKPGLLVALVVALAAALPIYLLSNPSTKPSETTVEQESPPSAQALATTGTAPQPDRMLEEPLPSLAGLQPEPTLPTYPEPPEYWARRIDRLVKGLTIASVDDEATLELLGEILTRAQPAAALPDDDPGDAVTRRRIEVAAPTFGVMYGHIEMQPGREGIRSSFTLAVPAPLRLMPGAQAFAESATLQFRVSLTDHGTVFGILELVPARRRDLMQEPEERVVEEYLASGRCGQTVQFFGIGGFDEWRFYPYGVGKSAGGGRVGDRRATLAGPVDSQWFHQRMRVLFGVD